MGGTVSSLCRTARGERPRALHGGGIAVLALHRRLHQSGQFAQHWPLSD